RLRTRASIRGFGEIAKCKVQNAKSICILHFALCTLHFRLQTTTLHDPHPRILRRPRHARVRLRLERCPRRSREPPRSRLRDPRPSGPRDTRSRFPSPLHAPPSVSVQPQCPRVAPRICLTLVPLATAAYTRPPVGTRATRFARPSPLKSPTRTSCHTNPAAANH